MRAGPTFLVSVLLCSFTCVCNGAPQGNFADRIKYTKEEDQFIVDELLNVLDGKRSLFSRGLWEKMSERHNEERQKGTPGFPVERSGSSLLSRFANVLIHNYLHTEVKVPQELIQKIRKRPRNEKNVYKYHWNQKENDFIIEELSKRANTGTNLFSASTIETLRAEHDKRREANTLGFENMRTADSILSRLSEMKDNCQLPPEVLERYPKRTRVSRSLYNIDEDNFIIEELSKPSNTGYATSITSIMDAIRAEHDKKRLAMVPGFETERSTASLRKHMYVMKSNGRIPDEVLKTLEANLTGGSSSSSTAPNQQRYLQGTNERLGEDEIADMIEEIKSNTDYDVDFNQLHTSTTDDS